MSFYRFQGCLAADDPSYVERAADTALRRALETGELSYVLTSRQMGKSSLLARARAGIAASGHHSILLDLQALGTRLTPEQWYDGFIITVGHQLRLSEPLDDYWLDHERVGPVQRFFAALRDVVLPRLAPAPSGEPARLTVFVDEIDTVNTLPFYADEFFAGIRECYNARVGDGELRRLNFCLAGVATLAELIRDPSNTPFLLGQRIELEEFPLATAGQLAGGLARPRDEAERLVQRVFEWTHGHPYLTQRLCQAIAETPAVSDPAAVDALCRDLFCSPQARDQEPNISFVRECLLRGAKDRERTLRLYDRVRRNQPVPDTPDDRAVADLGLSGIVRSERGLLVVRNRIYQEVFDDAWLRSLAVTVGDPDPRALAVLPFVDLSADPSEHLCDGLTDDLIRGLGRLPSIRVVSRDSVFAARDVRADPRQLGLELGASMILRGTLRRLGARVQVAAELISATDGRVLWGTTLRHAVEAWRALREELLHAVVEQLETGVGRATPGTKLVRARTANPQAYNLYLKGLAHLNQRGETPLKRSLTFFEGALTLDPAYAPALAGIADALILLAIYNCAAPNLAYPKARDAALRAIELEESLAEAHCALACTNAVYDRDYIRAELSFNRSIALNPSYATAYQWHAVMCLCPLGRHDDALAQLRQAQMLDPLSPSIPASLALAFFFAGRHNEGLEQAALALEMDDGFWVPHLFLGWIHEQTGKHGSALEHLEAARSLSHDDPAVVASQAHVHATAGNTREAGNVLEQLTALARSRYVAPAELALVCLALGRHAEAQKWLEKARQDHSYRLIYSRVDPRFKPAWAKSELAALL